MRQSPFPSAGPQFSAMTVPVLLPGSGAQPSMRHHPVAWASKLKPWMWKLQTCGSFFLIGSASPGSSWIFTVPLNPGGLLLLPPPVAAIGLDAANTKRARPVMKVRTPDALRISLVPPVLDLRGPVRGDRFALEAGPAPTKGKPVTRRKSAMPKSVTRFRQLHDSKRVVIPFRFRKEFLVNEPEALARGPWRRRHGPVGVLTDR